LDYQYLPHNIRFYRVIQGRSQDDLARSVEPPLSRSWIAAMEKGLWPASPEHVERVAKALGVPVAALLRRPRIVKSAADVTSVIVAPPDGAAR